MAEPKVDLIIKPCPFCGSTELIIDRCTARVRCRNCYATSGLITKLLGEYKKSDQNAPIKAWNVRSYEKTDG